MYTDYTRDRQPLTLKGHFGGIKTSTIDENVSATKPLGGDLFNLTLTWPLIRHDSCCKDFTQTILNGEKKRINAHAAFISQVISPNNGPVTEK